MCKSTEILFKDKKAFDIIQTASFTNLFETRLEKNSLFPDLKTYIFSRRLQLPASKFGSPDLELLMSDSTVNKVVQQIGGAASTFFFGASWLMDSN